MLTLEKNWSSPVEAGGPGEEMLKRLAPGQRELLLSTGSMTLQLEQRSSATVRVELRRSAEIDLPEETSGYLGLPALATPGAHPAPKRRAIEREVWLTADAVRLIYARTLIPLDLIDARLLELLESKNEEPIGRVLSSHKIPFSKLKLQLGTLRSAELAEDLNIKPDTLFTARRYILFNNDPKGDALKAAEPRLIKAVVFEIFNPALIGPTLQPAP